MDSLKLNRQVCALKKWWEKGDNETIQLPFWGKKAYFQRRTVSFRERRGGDNSKLFQFFCVTLRGSGRYYFFSSFDPVRDVNKLFVALTQKYQLVGEHVKMGCSYPRKVSYLIQAVLDIPIFLRGGQSAKSL